MAADFQSQFKKLQQRKELLVILLFLFVIILFWIALSIFSSQQLTGLTAQQQTLAAPLTPTLDTSVIETLEQKKMYDESELGDFPIFTVSDVLPAVSVTSQAGPEIILPEALEGSLEELEESF